MKLSNMCRFRCCSRDAVSDRATVPREASRVYSVDSRGNSAASSMASAELGFCQKECPGSPVLSANTSPVLSSLVDRRFIFPLSPHLIQYGSQVLTWTASPSRQARTFLLTEYQPAALHSGQY